MHNEFTTYSFFCIADDNNNEILESICNEGFPIWNYDNYDPKPECRYATAEQAESVLLDLSNNFDVDGLLVKERFIGDEFYEEIRSALNNLSDELQEYDDDHCMAAAVIRIVNQRKREESVEDGFGYHG